MSIFLMCLRKLGEALLGGVAIGGMCLLIGWLAISKIEPVPERAAMLHDDTCAVHPDAKFCEVAK